jgi:hypothetical protein
LAAVGLRDEAWRAASTARKLNDGLALGEGYFGKLLDRWGIQWKPAT